MFDLSHKLFRKILIFLFLSSPIPVHAVFVGLHGGVGSLNGTYLGVKPGSLNSISATAGGVSGQFGAIFGFSAIYKRAYMSLDITSLYDTISSNIANIQSSNGQRSLYVWTKSRFRFPAIARFGIIMRSLAPYFLIGAEYGRWDLQLKNETKENTMGIPTHKIVNFSSTQVSPKVGAGIVFKFGKKLFLRFDYSYSFGPKISRTLVDGEGNNWDHTFKIRGHSVGIGLLYHLVCP